MVRPPSKLFQKFSLFTSKCKYDFSNFIRLWRHFLDFGRKRIGWIWFYRIYDQHGLSQVPKASYKGSFLLGPTALLESDRSIQKAGFRLMMETVLACIVNLRSWGLKIRSKKRKIAAAFYRPCEQNIASEPAAFWSKVPSCRSKNGRRLQLFMEMS